MFEALVHGPLGGGKYCIVELGPALASGTHTVVVPPETPPTRRSTYVMLVRLGVDPALVALRTWPTAFTVVPDGAPVFTIAMPMVTVPAATFTLAPPPLLVVTLPLLLPAATELLGGEFTVSNKDAD
jgi:hypothetical protein